MKSSGLAADGGDFDATKPGAGREADRKFFFFFCPDYTSAHVNPALANIGIGLLEEKGMTTQSAAAAASGKKTDEDKEDKADKTSPDSPDSKKEKASLKDKIKAKLHKN